METIKRKFIDWELTAQNLRLLRNDNINLRRYVCRTLNYDKAECDGDCENCKFDMDSSISQKELASVFCVNTGSVVNWENGKSRPSIEDLIFYSQISGVDLYEVLIFKDEDKIKG